MRIGKADAVDMDLAPVRERPRPHRLSPSVEDMHVRREGELAGDLRLRVVIAADEIDADARRLQPPHLGHQEERRRHGGLRAVVKIAGDHEGVDRLGERDVDDALQRRAGRPAHEVAEVGIAEGQGGERRIEVQVSRVDEAERHGRTIASTPRRVNARRPKSRVMQGEMMPPEKTFREGGNNGRAALR